MPYDYKNQTCTTEEPVQSLMCEDPSLGQMDLLGNQAIMSEISNSGSTGDTDLLSRVEGLEQGPIGAPIGFPIVDPRAPVVNMEPNVRDMYQEQAYASLGIDEETFNDMDMEVRNDLINGAYAEMYMKDPETYKWAGMAAYASDKVGDAMWQANYVDMWPGAWGEDGVDAAEMRGALEAGNGVIFEDMYWQHLAFEQGGMEAIMSAAEQGDLDPEDVASWQAIHDGREMRAGNESGDAEAAQQAEDMIWEGNLGLLRREQEKVVQGPVYDTYADTFDWISGNSNPIDISSPIPGHDVPFEEFWPEGGRQHGDLYEWQLGDFEDRWAWTAESMVPAWRDRDTNDRGDVLDDMQELIDTANGTRGEMNQDSSEPAWDDDIGGAAWGGA